MHAHGLDRAKVLLRAFTAERSRGQRDDGVPWQEPGYRWTRAPALGWDPHTGELEAAHAWQQARVLPAPRGVLAGPASCARTELPLCPWCAGAPVCWRGRWQCSDAACARAVPTLMFLHGERWRSFPRSVRPGRVRAAPLFSSSEGSNSPSSGDCSESGPGLASCGGVGSETHAERLAAPRAPGGGCKENITPGKARWLAWLGEVETETSWHRRARAAHFARKRASHWHEVRRVGQAERFEKIRSCGRVDFVLQQMSADGRTVVAERPLRSRCDCWRLCARCLSARRYKLQKGLETQRKTALAQTERLRKRSYRGPEGRWAERMLTFTVPHGESPAADARRLVKAWQLWSRQMVEHLARDRGCEEKDARGKRVWLPESKPIWVRALEIAPGETGGHAHLHVWLVSPLLDATWLHVSWGRVLESLGCELPQRSWQEAWQSTFERVQKKLDTQKAAKIADQVMSFCRTRRGQHGRETDTVPWPIVSVNADRTSQAKKDGGAARYAQKVGVITYVLKADKTRARLTPVHAAAVYEALEGSRVVQWARSWAPKRVKSPHRWAIRFANETDRESIQKPRVTPPS